MYQQPRPPTPKMCVWSKRAKMVQVKAHMSGGWPTLRFRKASGAAYMIGVLWWCRGSLDKSDGQRRWWQCLSKDARPGGWEVQPVQREAVTQDQTAVRRSEVSLLWWETQVCHIAQRVSTSLFWRVGRACSVNNFLHEAMRVRDLWWRECE